MSFVGNKTIALATDRNFVELSGVLIRSICACGNVPDAQIVLFGDGLTSGDKRDLAACADRKITIIDVDGDIREQIRGLKTTYNWTAATYLRLLAPKIVQTQGRLLYLDCDIVINGDLGPLFAIALGGHALAAYRDEVRGYFNAGVLMIDLDKWRSESITERTLSWARSKGDAIRFLDQEALNAIVGDRYLPLGSEWNLQRREADNYASAAIIHFTGMKPDHAECDNPARVVYLNHRAQTPWANKPLVSKANRQIRRMWAKLATAPGRLARFLR